MAKNRAMFQIDREKLYEALKKRGLRNTAVCADLGMSGSYLANCAHRGKITETSAVLLERLYNIKREEYQLVQEEPVIPAKTPDVAALDYDKLYQTIYAAVYHAVKVVWSE